MSDTDGSKNYEGWSVNGVNNHYLPTISHVIGNTASGRNIPDGATNAVEGPPSRLTSEWTLGWSCRMRLPASGNGIGFGKAKIIGEPFWSIPRIVRSCGSSACHDPRKSDTNARPLAISGPDWNARHPLAQVVGSKPVADCKRMEFSDRR